MTPFLLFSPTEALQRSYTLPGNRDVPRTTITVEDIEDDEIFDEDDEEEDEEERNYFKDLPFYRQTTRRLKERMDIQLSFGHAQCKSG